MPKRNFVVVLVVLASLFSITACSDDGQAPAAQPTAEATATSAPEATATPTPTATPQPTATATPQTDSSEAAQSLAPLNLDDPQAFLSALSAQEQSCLADGNLGIAQVMTAMTSTDGAAEGDAILDCLEDETVLRMFLNEPLTATGELSNETSVCIRQGLGGMDLRPMMKSPGSAAGAMDARIVGMASFLTFTACLNDEEWGAASSALELGPRDKSGTDCLLAELGGPTGVAEALFQTDESGLPTGFIAAAAKCGVGFAGMSENVPGDSGSGGAGGDSSTEGMGLPPDTLHPVAIDDPEAFLSGLSPREQSCLGDKNIGPQELLQMTGRSPGGSPEAAADIVNCLQDDTVLRLFLTTLVGQVEPFSGETSSCIREGFVSFDLRGLMAPAVAGSTPENSLALGMVALNVSVVCMNDDEWDTYAPRLGLPPDFREGATCLFEELGGPAKLAEAMQASSLGEPEALAGALAACGDGTASGSGFRGDSLIWTFTTGGWVLTAPVVVDGVVYVGSDDGNLYALGADTGEQLWSFTTDDAVRSVPSVIEGTVYFGSNDGHIYALDAATGVELWRYETGSRVQYSPVVGNGKVYFPARGKYDRTVHAVDAHTGEVVWVAEPPYPIDERLAPTIHGGRVYAQGAEYGAFYALDAASGEIVWQAAVGGYVESPPTVLDGVVYLTVINQAHAFDEATGDLIWSVNTEEFPARDFPALVVDGIYYLAPSDYVYALDASTGEELWSYESYELNSAPVAADGVLYGASRSAEYLFALDAITGKVLWTTPTEDFPGYSLSVVAGVLYGQVHEGFLFAVDAGDGSVIPWQFETGGFEDFPHYVVSNGVVYAAGPGSGINAIPAPTNWREE